VACNVIWYTDNEGFHEPKTFTAVPRNSPTNNTYCWIDEQFLVFHFTSLCCLLFHLVNYILEYDACNANIWRFNFQRTCYLPDAMNDEWIAVQFQILKCYVQLAIHLTKLMQVLQKRWVYGWPTYRCKIAVLIRLKGRLEHLYVLLRITRTAWNFQIGFCQQSVL
jgi:hypothetical protein